MLDARIVNKGQQNCSELLTVDVTQDSEATMVTDVPMSIAQHHIWARAPDIQIFAIFCPPTKTKKSSILKVFHHTHFFYKHPPFSGSASACLAGS